MRQKSAFEATKPLTIDLGLAGDVDVAADALSREESFDFVEQEPQEYYEQDLGPSLVVESEFYPNVGVNVVYRRDHVVVGLLRDEMVMVKGQYALKMVSGSICVDGITLGQGAEQRINASTLTSLPLLVCNSSETAACEGLQGEYNAVIEIRNNDLGLNSVSHTIPALKQVFSSNSNQYTFRIITQPEPATFGNSIPDSWHNAIESVLETPQPKVLVLGNKGTGKSTLSKMVLNRLTARSSTQVLDIDPGQPEFTYPLTVSLSTLSKPIFGTVIPDLVEYDKHFVEFYGFNTPAVSPLAYFNHLQSLIGKLSRHALVINSPGWTKGFGVDIIKFMMSRVELTHVLILNENGRELDLLREIDFQSHEGLTLINLPAFSSREAIIAPSTATLSAAKIRTFKLLCPLHLQKGPRFDFSPLINRSPLQISYFKGPKTTSNVMQFNGLVSVSMLDSQGVSPMDLVECLEAQIVALHTVRSSDLEKKIPAMHSAPNMPLLLPESQFQSLDARFECLACVHSVNPANGTVNVYACVPSTLTKRLSGGQSKLVMVCGHTLVPAEELQLRGFDKMVPYSAPALSTPGSKPVVVRRTVQRGRGY